MFWHIPSKLLIDVNEMWFNISVSRAIKLLNMLGRLFHSNREAFILYEKWRRFYDLLWNSQCFNFKSCRQLSSLFAPTKAVYSSIFLCIFDFLFTTVCWQDRIGSYPFFFFFTSNLWLNLFSLITTNDVCLEWIFHGKER